MIIDIRAVPRAKKEKIEITADGLKVYFSDPALDGRANKKLIEMIAEHFKVKKYQVKIVRGEKSRDKIINVIL